MKKPSGFRESGKGIHEVREDKIRDNKRER
jgi:hypothetical protein